MERRRKFGDPLAGGKLGRRRPRGTPCAIGRQEPWLDEPECQRNHYSLGFCDKHYQRYSAHGDPLTSHADRDHPSTCRLEDCDLPYSANGYCRDHYNRAWLHDGDPLGGLRINSLDERILRRISEGPLPGIFYNHETDHYDGTPPCRCRDWDGTKTREGSRHKYGVISVKGTTKQVHRVTYEATFGPVPDGLDLDHLCCRTVCCEPRHLEPVTTGENSRRRWILIKEIVALHEADYIAGLVARRQSSLVWPEDVLPHSLFP